MPDLDANGYVNFLLGELTKKQEKSTGTIAALERELLQAEEVIAKLKHLLDVSDDTEQVEEDLISWEGKKRTIETNLKVAKKCVQEDAADDKDLLDRLEAEIQRQRDHELQMALIQRDTAKAQVEAAKLAAQANAKAQEQVSSSLDALINGIRADGSAKD